MSNKISVLAIDELHCHDSIKLFNKNWSVYYYLMSISHYNPKQYEMHRYVYKNSFKIKECCDYLNITKQTYYNSIKILQASGILVNCKQYIIISEVYSNFIKVDLNILKKLLSVNKYVGIDLLRIYLILLRLNKIDEKHFKYFTRKNIIEMLGHSVNHQEFYDIVDICLNILQDWNLIDFTRKEKFSTFGKVNIVSIEKIYESCDENVEIPYYIDEQIKTIEYIKNFYQSKNSNAIK